MQFAFSRREFAVSRREPTVRIVLTNGLRSFSHRIDDSDRDYLWTSQCLAVAQVDDFPLIGFQEFHHNFFHDFPTRASSQFPAVDRWLRSCLLMDFAVYRI